MNHELQQWIMMLSGFGSQKMEDIGIPAFLFLMTVALLVSIFISFLYVYFYQSRATGSQIHRAFPLIGISVTGIFICIQFSLPLSLGLLGSLSIVRFRTPIKEPEEVGFIMLLIAASISCATFNLVFLAILLTVAVLGLVLLKFAPRFLNNPVQDGMILITLADEHAQNRSAEILQFLESHLHRGKLESLSQNGAEMVLAYSFNRPKRHTIIEFQTELRAFIGNANMNMFFNRAEAA